MLEWNAWGAVRVVVGLAAAALAWLVYAARPGRFQNRVLAAGLAVDGVGFLGAGALFLVEDPRTAYGAIAVYMATAPASLLLYLLFVGTLDSPLARPLAKRPVRWLLVALAAASPFWVLARMDLYAATVFPVWFARWEVLFGPEYMSIFLVWIGVALYGLVVAVHAWRRAPRASTSRAAAKAVALAFGARDAFMTILVSVSYVRLSYETLGSDRGWDTFHLAMWPTAFVLYFGLLAYGILKAQLFDIDLKLKWTLKQSTVAAAFVAAFFVASETAAAFFSDRVGTYVGTLAAGVLVFALAPLQRLAERVSDRAMPDVRPTNAYVTYRKMEVYRAAAEGGYADGEITPKERAMLDRLRDQLGIAADDARALEDDLRAARGLTA